MKYREMRSKLTEDCNKGLGMRVVEKIVGLMMSIFMVTLIISILRFI